jgi:NCAIR mutase (PurE)-related protein
MNIDSLTKLLSNVASGSESVDNATNLLKNITSEDIKYANIDHHRCLRKGFPEVIYGEGKTSEQIIGIMEKMTGQENVVLVTRIDNNKASCVMKHFPDSVYHPDPRILIWEKGERKISGNGTILVLSAGTSDIPVAMEASITAKAMGNKVESVFDVGVAGIHRLFKQKKNN